MNEKTEQSRASDFAVSPRGQFIISQALCLALQSMKDRPNVEREFSNEEDMRYLIDNLFPVYEVAFTDQGGALMLDRILEFLGILTVGALLYGLTWIIFAITP